MLLSVSLASAENSIDYLEYKFKIDPTQSWLQLFDNGSNPSPINDTLIPFGGLIDIRVANYYVDTHEFNGQHLTPRAFSSIRFEFPSLELPDEVNDFNLDFFPSFDFENGIISGNIYDVCTYTRATGGSCSGFSIYNGSPPRIEGTFDGETLEATGAPLVPFSATEYYQFNIVASPVPIPPALFLLAPSVFILGMCRNRKAA